MTARIPLVLDDAGALEQFQNGDDIHVPGHFRTYRMVLPPGPGASYYQHKLEWSANSSYFSGTITLSVRPDTDFSALPSGFDLQATCVYHIHFLKAASGTTHVYQVPGAFNIETTGGIHYDATNGKFHVYVFSQPASGPQTISTITLVGNFSDPTETLITPGSASSIGLNWPSAYPAFAIQRSSTATSGTINGRKIATFTAGGVTTAANLVLAGPASGSAALMDVRALVRADLPTEVVSDNVNPVGRVFRSILPNHATALQTIDSTAYFVYVGKTTQAITPKYVECYMTTVGTGAQTAEIGLFSSPIAPNKGGQSLTKLVSTATVDTLSATAGVKRNTSAFATSIAAGTHLWAGIRTAMATNEPSFLSLGYDMAQGNVMSIASASALTAAGLWSASIITASTSQIAPDLRVVMD